MKPYEGLPRNEVANFDAFVDGLERLLRLNLESYRSVADSDKGLVQMMYIARTNDSACGKPG